MQENAFELSLPTYKRAKIELWKYLDSNDIQTIINCFQEQHDLHKYNNTNKSTTISSTDTIEYALTKKILQKKLNLNSVNTSKRDLILIDAYYNIFKFSFNNNFNKEQISALILTFNKIHKLTISTAYGNLDQVQDYLKQLLLLYSVYRPPFSLKLFEPPQTKLVYNYFIDTYIKHFKLFKLIFTPSIKLDLKFNYSNSVYEKKDDNLNDGDDEVEEIEQFEQNQSQQQEEQQQQQQSYERFDLDESKTSELNSQRDIVNKDLKAFIKNYLTKSIEKVKIEFENEIKDKEADLQRKLSQINPTPPQTQGKGGKKK